MGNPILIGLVLVWRLKDTYKALFEIDSQTMASKSNEAGASVAGRMKAFEDFVRVQSDAALRQVLVYMHMIIMKEGRMNSPCVTEERK